MQTKFELIAEFRDDQGKGASRRLRRAGRVPAILYGGRNEPRALTFDHAKVQMALDNERFYSSIIMLKVGSENQAAILRDVQRHPWKNQVVHVDMQRVLEDEPIRLEIPLHFKGGETCPGVKSEGGMVSHLRNQLEISCLPKDLPEYVEVDISELHLNQSLHLSNVVLPPGVTAIEAAQGRDPAIVAVHSLRAEEPEAVAAVADAAAATPAAGADAAAAAAPADKKAEAAKPAAKAEPKKDAAKK